MLLGPTGKAQPPPACTDQAVAEMVKFKDRDHQKYAVHHLISSRLLHRSLSPLVVMGAAASARRDVRNDIFLAHQEGLIAAESPSVLKTSLMTFHRSDSILVEVRARHKPLLNQPLFSYTISDLLSIYVCQTHIGTPVSCSHDVHVALRFGELAGCGIVSPRLR